MLNFFRLNDPYRLIGVFILLVICRMPFWLGQGDILIPELRWMLAGERMSDGFMMYYEIWDYISPLSAGTYWILDWMFGRSQWAYLIPALFVSFFQAALFNYIAIKGKIFSENNYIPGIIYALLSSAFFDFFTLSPMLLGLTFVLLALNNVISQIEFRARKDEKLFSIGLYLGIAALFHFPLAAMGPFFVIALVLFSSTVPRRYLLILYGWILPFALTVIYFYFADTLEFFQANHLAPWFILAGRNIVSYNFMPVLAAPVVIYLLLAIVRIARRARLTNYQSRVLQMMFTLLVLSSLVLYIEIDRYPFVLLVFVPALSYFVSYFFILGKKGPGTEIFFIILLTVMIGINWKSTLTSNPSSLFNFRSYYVIPHSNENMVKGKKVAFLGDNISIYRDAYPATPFINWRISQYAWENMNRYVYLSLIMNSILNEKPGYVIDTKNYFNKLTKKAPVIRQQYRKEGKIYIRISN